MKKDEFEQGAFWAYRTTSTLGAPAQKVELIFLAKGRSRKVKIRHVDGEYEGLEEFVSLMHLRCPWNDWPKLSKLEARELAMIEFVERDEIDRVVLEAAQEVLAATGDDLFIDGYRGYTGLDVDAALERVAARAGIEDRPWRARPAFRGRQGLWYVPDTVLVNLAIAFAGAEPATVHLHLDRQEAELLRDGYLGFGYGDEDAHQRLLKRKPAFAVARQWAGGLVEHRHLHDQLEELYKLVTYAIAALEASDAPRKAHYLQRALDKV